MKKKIDHPLKGPLFPEELEEVEALMILTLMPSVGTARIKFLINFFGSALKALLASSEEISVLPYFNAAVASNWKRWPVDNSWKSHLILIDKYGASLVPYTSSAYPKGLRPISDAPLLLYMYGDYKERDNRAIAVVGTRKASLYGQEMARRFSCELAAMGYTIVSGLARGVDTCAHLGALERGRTVAVIGSGLASIYPPENRSLVKEIALRGAVFSEFPMGTPPDRQNFPQRNRIVSAMTLATLLIEAPIKSGAMITMEKARAQGKPLFAIPGRIDYENFTGNHAAIRKGAMLVESAAEIAGHFEDLFGRQHFKDSKKSSEETFLSQEEANLLSLLPKQELSIEQIAALTRMPMPLLNATLMKLTLKGSLKEFPGKVFMKKELVR